MTSDSKGYIHVYTGNGKGKTTCAVGLTVRAAGAGLRIAFLQFDKGFEGRNEHYHERFVLRQLPQVEMYFYGMERMMADGKFRFANIPEDLAQAEAGLAKAAEILNARSHDLIVCDEAITCVGTKLYDEDALFRLIRIHREVGGCDLVLTGRGATEALCAEADLVSEIRLVKHYFYHGVEARKGIEY